MLIDWRFEVETDDRYRLFEIEIVAEVELECVDNAPVVELDGFFIEACPPAVPFYLTTEIKPTKRVYFSAHSPNPWMRHFFLNIKEQLEMDEDFIEAVVSESGEDFSRHDPNEEHRLTLSQLI